MQQGKKYIVYIIGIVLVIFISLFSWYLSTPQQKNFRSKNSTTSQTFTSEKLKFSVVVPYNFKTVEEGNTVILNSGEQRITIVNNATNYNNLSNYLQVLDSNKNIDVRNTTPHNINELSAISRTVIDLNTNVAQKVYYIHNNNSVYELSTTSENLYDELDQIAQSFKVTP